MNNAQRSVQVLLDHEGRKGAPSCDTDKGNAVVEQVELGVRYGFGWVEWFAWVVAVVAALCFLTLPTSAQEYWFPEPSEGVTFQSAYEANIQYDAEIMPDVLAAGVSTGVMDALVHFSDTNDLDAIQSNEWGRFFANWGSVSNYGDYAFGTNGEFEGSIQWDVLRETSNQVRKWAGMMASATGRYARLLSVLVPEGAGAPGERLLLVSTRGFMIDHVDSFNDDNGGLTSQHGGKLYAPEAGHEFWSWVVWIKQALTWLIPAYYFMAGCRDLIAFMGARSGGSSS